MTTEQTQAHDTGHTAEPLALKLTAELGFLPEPDFCLDGGTLRCYYADTVRTIQAAERERCAALCEQEHAESGEHPEMALHCAERIRGLRA